MVKLGSLLFFAGVVLLAAFGFAYRPSSIRLGSHPGEFAIQDVDYSQHSDDRMVGAMAGASLMICGAIFWQRR